MQNPNDAPPSLAEPSAPPVPAPTSPSAIGAPPPIADPFERPTPMVGDATGGIIPYKNTSALLSYYIGLFSLLPLFGYIMGPAAVVLGVKGLRHYRAHPETKGKVHAWGGILCGGFWTLVHLLLTGLFLAAIASNRR